MRKGWPALLFACATSALAMAACQPSASGPPGEAADRAAERTSRRAVTDMRGAAINVPMALTRVATINDGFVEAVMTRLGTIRTLVAVGSSSQQRTWSYSYPARDGRTFTVADGMGTMRALHPWIAGLPCASRTSGEAINYETIAAAGPQVVIMRVGDCTVGTAADAVARTAGVFEGMGIPVVVLRSPADFRGQGLETLQREIEVLGRLFQKEGEAAALAAELATTETMIQSRVQGVAAASRPRVLYLGLASGARASGGAAYVWGADTAESWMIERMIGARNAYQGPGARVLLNAEQILALDPDVIFLPTAAGYHPPQELADAPYFRDLQRLRAVRDGRVYALPWSPMNCARRLEYPLDLLIMAKGTYPDRFRDIAVHEWALAFYRQTYLVDERQARELRRGQWLEWTAEAGF
ncbi:MAG: ABC transporter substrate-binding protein [Vicinamibacterales bacterium]|jgi:iron complex transport system substrate-binding protein|nr:ABC transporter substrate-binding protein [Vicinamibacterales bacterium]